MHALRYAIALSGALLLASSPAQAQMRRSSSIPSTEMPPAGLCRIWIDGVPASRQPAPTDCTTARANAPANSHIIYGSQSQGSLYGNVDPRTDPRLDPRDPRYDPRLDPRDPRYNADYARRVLNDGRYANANGQYSNNGRYGNGDRAKWDAKERARYERERAKAERKREKEARKDRKHDDDDRDDHRGRGHDHDDHDRS
jgi:hypothetical protein